MILEIESAELDECTQKLAEGGALEHWEQDEIDMKGMWIGEGGGLMSRRLDVARGVTLERI